jgi:PhnB protein
VSTVKPIPDGYPAVSCYLCVNDGKAAIEFYSQALGATERMRIEGPGGTIGHAELQLADSVIMLSDEFPEMGVVSPVTLGGSPVTIGAYVDDVDATFARAIAAGATAEREPEDQFYGDRSGRFRDPFGHRWSVSTHIEDVTPEEIQRRAAAFMGGP